MCNRRTFGAVLKPEKNTVCQYKAYKYFISEMETQENNDIDYFQ